MIKVKNLKEAKWLVQEYHKFLKEIDSMENPNLPYELHKRTGYGYSSTCVLCKATLGRKKENKITKNCHACIYASDPRTVTGEYGCLNAPHYFALKNIETPKEKFKEYLKERAKYLQKLIERYENEVKRSSRTL